MREKVQVNGGNGWEGSALEEIFEGSPYPISSSLKLLGVIFDSGLDFHGQLQSIMGRAQVRLAVLARVAGDGD